jgi:hypothetical protein
MNCIKQTNISFSANVLFPFLFYKCLAYYPNQKRRLLMMACLVAELSEWKKENRDPPVENRI